MGVFTDAELEYLGTQRLARLATASHETRCESPWDSRRLSTLE